MKTLTFILMLLVAVAPVFAADPAPTVSNTFTKQTGDVSKINDSEVNFELSLNQLVVFDAGFSSNEVRIGTPPTALQVVSIDTQKKATGKTDLFKSSDPVYMYLRFFGSKSQAPNAEVSLVSPLTTATKNNSLHWMVKGNHISSKGKNFTLRSDDVNKQKTTIMPVFPEGNPGNSELINVVDCYKLVFETTEPFWKAAPESYSGELWLKIIPNG